MKSGLLLPASLQSLLIALSYYVSFVLRLELPLNQATRIQFWETLPLVAMIKLTVFYSFGLLRGSWRYAGMSDIFKIVSASSVSAMLVYGLVAFAIGKSGYLLSVVLIDLLVSVVLVGGARFVVRAYLERPRISQGQKNSLIVGAGQAGRSLVAQLRSNQNVPYFPIGFVDDDPTKLQVEINGLRVLGNTAALGQLISKYAVECVLIVNSSVRDSVIEEIAEKCRKGRVLFKILPAFGDMLEGPHSFKETSKLNKEELLGRQPVHLDHDQVRGCLQNKVLLVTGCGGFIGTELVRQAAILEPKQIVLFDRSENELFKLGRELSNKFPGLACTRVVGDILDVNRLREVFGEHQPHTVFHAAGYKHVPIMEENCFQAVTNNIFGTYNVALLAQEYRANDFVLISSDKAVNPTNIIGVTKRVGELIILALQFNKTRFTAVRLGNVIDSKGSVVPIFEEQIANGGPVTVTHADAKRYFMTVSEAAFLVLQASAVGKGGEIFVLDMGEPIKIIDLANRMIRRASGKSKKNVPIVFTGCRPGEKLFEEPRLESEQIVSTLHGNTHVFKGTTVNFEQMQGWLEDLSFLSQSRNVYGLVQKLKSIVPEYQPSEEILLLSQIDRHDLSIGYKSARSVLTAEAGAA